MNLATIRALFEFGDWANERIFAQVARLTDVEFASAPIAALPSARQILVHALGAEMLWLSRFRTGSSVINVAEEQFPDYEGFRREWDRQRAALREYLATLDDAALAGLFRFERRGTAHEMLRWQIFFQLLNHEMQHRTEVAAILTALGHSPGDLDFLFYLMQGGRAATSA